MRLFGGVLLMVGFFAAAFVAVRHADAERLEWWTIEWGWYAAAFAVGLAGVVMLRATARRSGTLAHKLDADLAILRDSLDRLVEKLTALCADRRDDMVYEVHQRIDDTLMEDLTAFVEARESLIHVHGLQAYADLMNRFALSERNINRAWSASADGYADEVWTCMDRAVEEMRAARQLLREAGKESLESPT